MAAEARQIGGAPESAGVAADGVAPRRDDGGAGVRVDDVDGVVGCASALVRKHGNTAQIGVAASVGYLITYFIRYPMFILDLPTTPVGGTNMSLQTWFSLASTVGFGLSKIPAYRVVSQMNRGYRFQLLLGLIAAMLICTVAFFAVLPPWGQILGVFLGALPGSWVYGIVFSYMEGRNSTEVLNSIIYLAIIFGGSLSRAVGTLVLDAVPQEWMPLTTAAIYLPVSLLGLLFLHRAHGPSSTDISNKSARRPMTGAERGQFLRRFAPGIILMLLAYVLLMVFRSFRDYFVVQIYKSVLDEDHVPASLYLLADWPAGVVSCLATASVAGVTRSRTALLVLHAISIAGSLVLLAVALLFKLGVIESKEFFIIGVGMGLYVAFAPLGSLMYDRMFAASGTQGTTVFLIYMTDAAGYIGTTSLLLVKGLYVDNSADIKVEWGAWFVWACIGVAIGASGLLLLSAMYFAAVLPPDEDGDGDAKAKIAPYGEGGGAGSDLDLDEQRPLIN